MNSVFSKIPYETEKFHRLAIAVIVSGDGSAPRGTGAMMLVSGKGRIVGTIGGGAIEHQAEKLAVGYLIEGRSTWHDFTLRENDREDIGMTCGGNVTVWFQYINPYDAGWQELCRKVLEMLASGKRGTLYFNKDGRIPTLADEGGNAICGRMTPDEAYAVPLKTRERAIVFGGGHCASALEPLLRSVGFRVTIMDNREEYANPERFPYAEQVICGDFERISDYVTLDANDYVVVMTSGHSFDYEVERQVLSGQYAYIGVIGSRSKIKAANEKLAADGIPEEKFMSVHTPIGLPIKAVTPEEIAVSIAAEMILLRAGRREAAGSFENGCPMHL